MTDYYTEETIFESIFECLLFSGEFEGEEDKIEYKVHEIMDNPHIYPEYFLD